MQDAYLLRKAETFIFATVFITLPVVATQVHLIGINYLFLSGFDYIYSRFLIGLLLILVVDSPSMLARFNFRITTILAHHMLQWLFW